MGFNVLLTIFQSNDDKIDVERFVRKNTENLSSPPESKKRHHCTLIVFTAV